MNLRTRGKITSRNKGWEGSTHLASTVRVRNGFGAIDEKNMVRAGPKAIKKWPKPTTTPILSNFLLSSSPTSMPASSNRSPNSSPPENCLCKGSSVQFSSESASSNLPYHKTDEHDFSQIPFSQRRSRNSPHGWLPPGYKEQMAMMSAISRTDVKTCTYKT